MAYQMIKVIEAVRYILREEIKKTETVSPRRYTTRAMTQLSFLQKALSPCNPGSTILPQPRLSAFQENYSTIRAQCQTERYNAYG